MPRRKFIDRKNAVTFELVPKTEVDPTASPYERVARLKEWPRHEKFNINLPGWNVELPCAGKISSLKKCIQAKGTQPDWDPDIAAALDDDFSHDDTANALEDNFVAMANAPIEESQFSDASDGGSWESDDDDDPSFRRCGKGKSGLSEYSMTSAVSNCPEEIQIFNERFEKLCEAYTDDQIGDLELEDIEGGSLTSDSKIVKEFTEEFQKMNEKFLRYAYDNELDTDVKAKILQSAMMPEKEEPVEIVFELPPEYDCESIRGLYTNKHNHPKVIKMEKEEKPVKISTNPQKNRLTKSNLKQFDREVKTKEEDEESVASDNNETIVSTCNLRPKDETPEERRLRKAAVKQIRRENRMIKKENKLAFKEEKKRQICVALNAKKNRIVRLF